MPLHCVHSIWDGRSARHGKALAPLTWEPSAWCAQWVVIAVQPAPDPQGACSLSMPALGRRVGAWSRDAFVNCLSRVPISTRHLDVPVVVADIVWICITISTPARHCFSFVDAAAAWMPVRLQPPGTGRGGCHRTPSRVPACVRYRPDHLPTGVPTVPDPRSSPPTGRSGPDLPRQARQERTADLGCATPGPWAGDARSHATENPLIRKGSRFALYPSLPEWVTDDHEETHCSAPVSGLAPSSFRPLKRISGWMATLVPPNVTRRDVPPVRMRCHGPLKAGAVRLWLMLCSRMSLIR